MSNHDQHPEACAHNAQLSALYQRTRKDEPPAQLDAAILAAAHREVAAGPLRANTPARVTRWRIPLALAATMVLGIGVVTLIRQHEEPKESMNIAMLERAPSEIQLPEVQLKSAPAPQESVAEMKDALIAPTAPVVRDVLKKRTRVPEANVGVEERVALAQSPQADALSRLSKAEPMSLPVSEARAKSTELEKNSQATEPIIEVGESTVVTKAEKFSVPAAVSSQPSTGSTLRMFAAEQALPSPAISAKVASKPKAIEAWLKEIAKLRVEGRTEESALQLQMFKKAYPDVPEEKITTSLSTYEREWRDAEKAQVVPQNIEERN